MKIKHKQFGKSIPYEEGSLLFNRDTSSLYLDQAGLRQPITQPQSQFLTTPGIFPISATITSYPINVAMECICVPGGVYIDTYISSYDGPYYLAPEEGIEFTYDDQPVTGCYVNSCHGIKAYSTTEKTFTPFLVPWELRHLPFSSGAPALAQIKSPAVTTLIPETGGPKNNIILGTYDSYWFLQSSSLVTEDTVFEVTSDVTVLQPGTYTFWGSPHLRITIGEDTYSAPKTFSISTPDTPFKVHVFVAAGEMVDEFLYPQIELGSVPTFYGPSVNSVSTQTIIPNSNTCYSVKILPEVYPVGAIYMSADSTNPNTLFAGTWERIKDKFLLAAGDSYSAGAVGGEATHTLTVAEMPKHAHNLAKVGTNYWVLGPTVNSDTINSGTGNWDRLDTIESDYAGSGAAHNNMPPYLTVYMWKRTA